MLLTTIYNLKLILNGSVLDCCPEMNVHFPVMMKILPDLKSQNASFYSLGTFCLFKLINSVFPLPNNGG